MELVIDKELLKIYFDSLTPKAKKEKIRNLILSIESSKNKMKISSAYLDILEEYFNTECNSQKDFFQMFIKSLWDDNRIISFKTNIKSNNEEDILEEMMNFEHKDFTFLLTNQLKFKKYTKNQSVFTNINKPNLDWLILSLSSCNVVQLDYSDFNSALQVESIFKHCCEFPKNGKVVYIVDSYFSLNRSSQLKSFKEKGHSIKCYTCSFNKSEQEKSMIRNLIKGYFGNKTAVLFSRDKTITHDRKLLIENLIIESTHDFSEINIKNKNWCIYVVICDNKKDALLNKLAKYN